MPTPSRKISSRLSATSSQYGSSRFRYSGMIRPFDGFDADEVAGQHGKPSDCFIQSMMRSILDIVAAVVNDGVGRYHEQRFFSIHHEGHPAHSIGASSTE